MARNKMLAVNYSRLGHRYLWMRGYRPKPVGSDCDCVSGFSDARADCRSNRFRPVIISSLRTHSDRKGNLPTEAGHRTDLEIS